jgi:hypothetical protein
MRCVSGKLSASYFTKILLVILLVSSTSFAADRVIFSIFARVQFSVPADWLVISSKSDVSKTVFAFQIPNAADEKTHDSSNLSIIASDLKTPEDKAAFEKKGSHPDPKSEKRELVDEWSCSSFSAKQAETRYVIWDCHRIVDKCGVSVRMAWPLLTKNPLDYDKQMETALTDVLKSVGATQESPAPYRTPNP